MCVTSVTKNICDKIIFQTPAQGKALKNMEGTFFRTIGDPKVSEGAHRLILSILLAVTTLPKTAVSTFPILATLGHVTDQLQIICGWDASLLQKVKDTHKLRNKKINNTCLFQMFFDQFDATGLPGSTFSPTPTVGRYYKLMLTEFSQAKLDKIYWQSSTDVEDIADASVFADAYKVAFHLSLLTMRYRLILIPDLLSLHHGINRRRHHDVVSSISKVNMPRRCCSPLLWLPISAMSS